MKRLTVALLLLVMMLGAMTQMAAAAHTTHLVGLIASVDRQAAPALRLVSKNTEARTIRTDTTTKYVKWVTHQPWQQDTRLSSQALVSGRCVDVELRLGNTTVAESVRISDEPAGSVFDPCKGQR